MLSEPDALVAFFLALDLPLTQIGLEAGPLSQWLHAGLVKAGLPVVLLETRHVKAALSAMIVKTDRKDARGIAQLLRMGWYRPVHCKSLPAQEVRALLAGRKLLQTKLLDIEFSIRGLLRGFGLKMGEVSKGRFAARVEELMAGHTMLEQIMSSMLAAREALRAEYNRLHRAMLAIVRKDAVCRRLMTAQGVGAVTAITYKSAVDDPARFAKSKAVGTHFGMTQKRYQSGETDIKGSISKVGDVTVRTALFEAAECGADPVSTLLEPQVLGSECRQASRHEARQSGSSTQACGDLAPDVGGPRASVATARSGGIAVLGWMKPTSGGDRNRQHDHQDRQQGLNR